MTDGVNINGIRPREDDDNLQQKETRPVDETGREQL